MVEQGVLRAIMTVAAGVDLGSLPARYPWGFLVGGIV